MHRANNLPFDLANERGKEKERMERSRKCLRGIMAPVVP